MNKMKRKNLSYNVVECLFSHTHTPEYVSCIIHITTLYPIVNTLFFRCTFFSSSTFIFFFSRIKFLFMCVYFVMCRRRWIWNWDQAWKHDFSSIKFILCLYMFYFHKNPQQKYNSEWKTRKKSQRDTVNVFLSVIFNII